MNLDIVIPFYFIVVFTHLCFGSQQFVGIATTTANFRGISSNCSDCTTSQYFSNYDCSSSSTWNNGTRQFINPVPSGYMVQNINLTIYLTFGCINFTENNILVTVDSSILNIIENIYETDDCNCTACMQSTKVIGIGYSKGWPNYSYNGTNELKIWSNSYPLCISNVTISIGYTNPIPQLLAYYPSLIPVNTPVNISIIGKDFEPGDIFCSFGGNFTNATYEDSTRLNCPAIVSSLPQSTVFQVIDNQQVVTSDDESFFWYKNPVITSFYPTQGPSQGINVTLTGTGFFHNSTILCLFGGNPIRVQYINSTTVICVDVTDYKNNTPRNVTVGFSENAHNYVYAQGTYEFLGLVGISPTPSTSPLLILPTPSVSNSNSTGLPIFAWVAIAIAILIAIVILIGGILIAIKSKVHNKTFSQEYGDETSISDYGDGQAGLINYSDDSTTIPMEEIKNLKQIEKGSFGVIYEANWRGTKIAVKKIPSTITNKLKSEFYKEATLMQSLRHPNILQYLGVSHSGKEICICMEYMPRGSLYRILHNKNSEYSLDKIKSICMDTVRGMNYLHQQQPPIIHRDLKSHNLLVDKHWQVKICDFGLSRITEQNKTMTACGTPSWTAPEVLRNERYTTKADVYGFGIVIWELFARQDPFPGMPPFQIVFAVGTQNLRPKIEPQWPLPWINLMKSCWQEKPDKRPTFEKLIEIIENMDY